MSRRSSVPVLDQMPDGLFWPQWFAPAAVGSAAAMVFIHAVLGILLATMGTALVAIGHVASDLRLSRTGRAAGNAGLGLMTGPVTVLAGFYLLVLFGVIR